MARGVRQGCTASGFLFAMAFDSFTIRSFPTDTAAPDFLQTAPCAYADDFAVAASSFRSLMTALSPTFEVMDCVAGLHLNHRKCCKGTMKAVRMYWSGSQ